MEDATVAIRVVTISASYGAGGSIVGPDVAERLGLPFLDRAIPSAVAERLSVPVEDALSHDERVQSRFWSALAIGGGLGFPGDMASTWAGVEPEERFHAQTEEVIRTAADAGGGVILGRAAAIVLGARPDTLRVRLDGPRERRIAQAVRVLGLEENVARKRQHDLDRAWDAYVRRFYRVDATQACHYDIVLDGTAIALDRCAELIVAAAHGSLRR